jgi:glycosyltransferase involved in cell wall biosynthesis
MDDHSIDDTVEICRRIAKVDVFRSPFDNLNEARDKNYLLDLTQVGDWIVMIDGDELLAPNSVLAVRQATNAGLHAGCYSLQVLYLWDREDQMRTDGVYGQFWRPSLFKRGHARFLATSAGGNFHCGNVPLAMRASATRINAAVWHFGYLQREDRLRKFEWYNRVDPHNPLEDEYRHMVQGDLPGIPANLRLMHAGPLRLEAL